jgi:hypothetical protein
MELVSGLGLFVENPRLHTTQNQQLTAEATVATTSPGKNQLIPTTT